MLNFRLIDPLIELAIVEDVGSGDITTESTISKFQVARGTIVVHSSGIIAGLPIAERVFGKIDPSLKFESFVSDGYSVQDTAPIANVVGTASSILTGERIVLNFLQRLSGTATLTAEFVAATVGYPVKILDTRKTTAGWRTIQKYAVRVGGGYNHRFGLYDGILIKDNHIIAAGGITQAVEQARSIAPHTSKIEIEVESLDQVQEALQAQADILLFDNMPAGLMKAAVKEVNGRAITEASGGITLEKVDAVAASGVDLISVGALTHSAAPLDISLDLEIC